MVTYNNLTTPRQAPSTAEEAAKQQAIDLAMISPKTATSSPTPEATPSTTVTRSPSLYSKSLTDLSGAASSYEDQLQKARTYAASQREARINAINDVFAPRIAREQKLGEGRIQRVKALAFKGGITGSGVDTTKIGAQQDLNEAAIKGIEADRAAAIQEAFDKADALAMNIANSAYERSLKSAEAKVTEEKNRLDTAMESLKLFSTGGKVTSASDLMKADPASFNTLKNVTGMTDSEIDTYLKVNAPKGTYVWDQAKISGDKMYVPTIKNGVPTMEEVKLGFTPKKEPQSVTKTDQGVFVLYKDGTYQSISTPQNPTSDDRKTFINKQIATPEFKKLSDTEKTDYIRSQGGNPYDYGF